MRLSLSLSLSEKNEGENEGRKRRNDEREREKEHEKRNNERERRDHEKMNEERKKVGKKYLFEFDAILIAGFPAIGLDFRFDSFSPSNGESEEGNEKMRERIEKDLREGGESGGRSESR